MNVCLDIVLSETQSSNQVGLARLSRVLEVGAGGSKGVSATAVSGGVASSIGRRSHILRRTCGPLALLRSTQSWAGQSSRRHRRWMFSGATAKVNKTLFGCICNELNAGGTSGTAQRTAVCPAASSS